MALDQFGWTIHVGDPHEIPGFTEALGRARCCKRCESREDLREVAHPCGCVNLFCGACRTGARQHELGKARWSDHDEWGKWSDHDEWVKRYSDMHRKLGGRRAGPRPLECPVRWDDPRWLLPFAETYFGKVDV